MPTQDGVDRDWRPAHKAVPHVVPNSEPRMFAGSCAAGDFASPTQRDSEAEAMADVAEHVAQNA